MGRTASHNTPYLAVDDLAADLGLVRRLPADLAWRFHALPLAEDKDRITVVMADPDDPAARKALAGALGATICVVQGDRAAIDSLLTKVWGSPSNHLLELLVCTFPEPMSEGLWGYAQAVGGLLGAQVGQMDAAEGFHRPAAGATAAGSDRIIVGDPSHPLLRRLLSRRNKLSATVLAVRQPRFPFGRILLILCGVATDRAAVDWTIRLVCGSPPAVEGSEGGRTDVVVLAVVPPVRRVAGPRSGMDQGLPALLTSETPLGRQMQGVARHLVEKGIQGTLRLRQGPLNWQIHSELGEGDYDLIVLGAVPCPWWQSSSEEDLISTVLRCADSPVLIARSELAASHLY